MSGVECSGEDADISASSTATSSRSTDESLVENIGRVSKEGIYSHACMHVVSSLILVSYISACRECQYKKISKTTHRPFATEYMYTQVKHATRGEKAAGGIVGNEEAARPLHANVQRLNMIENVV